MINAIIVENEQPQSNYLKTLLLKEFPEIIIQAICENIPDAILQVNSLKPDLIFLDVELPPYTGFDLLEKTKGLNYKIIFTTSHNQYAVKAIKVCALDYLLKPFGLNELKEAITKYKDASANTVATKVDILLSNLKQPDMMMNKVGIPVLGGYDFINVAEIILCKSDNNYTEIQLTGNKRIIATKTLKWVSELLSDYQFFRVHDSYFINLNHIVQYKREGESGMVVMTDRKEADVSRRKKDEFIKLLGNLKMISMK